MQFKEAFIVWQIVNRNSNTEPEICNINVIRLFFALRGFSVTCCISYKVNILCLGKWIYIGTSCLHLAEFSITALFFTASADPGLGPQLLGAGKVTRYIYSTGGSVVLQYIKKILHYVVYRTIYQRKSQLQICEKGLFCSVRQWTVIQWREKDYKCIVSKEWLIPLTILQYSVSILNIFWCNRPN